MEIRWKDVKWINPAQDREKRWAFVNTAMNCQIPQNVCNCQLAEELTASQEIFRSMELVYCLTLFSNTYLTIFIRL
jgi:hypothetical protein